MQDINLPQISVAIPTYNREKILLDTIKQLLTLDHKPNEILVIDQTIQHERETDICLEKLSLSKKITWTRLDKPSIPQAMNHALSIAKSNIVLFIDDDIEIISNLVEEHAREYLNKEVNIVAGQVNQSWDNEIDDNTNDQSFNCIDPENFSFNTNQRQWIKRFMGGNFSIKKDIAIKIGGMDENFVKVAYRYEAEFAERLLEAGYAILFQPKASIKHLKIEQGGTRVFGNHLTTIKPTHSVGRYYYYFRSRNINHRLYKILISPLLAIKTKFHLNHPWWIPVTFISELLGLLWAIVLYIRGPRYINSH